MLFLPPAKKLRQGYVFTGVCDSVHRRGRAWGWGYAWQGGACMSLGHVWQGACVAGETATAVGGTHPTGMHSCIYSIFTVRTEKAPFALDDNDVVFSVVMYEQ